LSSSSNLSNDAVRRRVDAVRDQVAMADVVGRVVPLGRGANPRGKCPFHGSKSESFTVYPARAQCWGCSWAGDALKFVQDFFQLNFMEALQRLESEHGLDGLSPKPVKREKVERRRPERIMVDSVTMGRHIWRKARPDHDAIRTYFRSRGVPDAMLTDARFADIRFLGSAPISAWEEGRKPDSVPNAPAMAALIRHAPDWTPIGLHVTFLAPDLGGKMVRARHDGSAYPDRKMLGNAAGGCIVLGHYDAEAPLFVGEGLETVLSGMSLGGADASACGLAVLSLDNLQGHARLLKGALPLFDPQPDPDRGRAVAFRHRGPVIGLIDADMKPLRGPRHRQTGAWLGVPVIEKRRGPIVRRSISTGERAGLCAALLVQAWRAAGCRVRAVRPPMGRDFNDAVREGPK
jgi:DNA primase